MSETGVNIHAPKPRIGFDYATFLGIAAAFLLIATAVYLGGSPKSFINPPSILIVIGGTLAVTTACFSIKEMAGTLSIMGKTLLTTSSDAASAAVQVLQIAELARRQGILAIQNVLGSIEHEKFLHHGISMVVDGTPGEEVEYILRREMTATLQRHNRSVSILRKMSEFAPAMGLIGTLIGLVQMLGNLDDPSSIGPSMAVALLTTLYGAVLANLLFLPLAAKLERNSNAEAMVKTIFILGAASIGRQENPRRLEMVINSILPPSKRINYFD